MSEFDHNSAPSSSQSHETATATSVHAADRLTARSWLEPHGDHAPLSTNQGAYGLAFQRWYRFKEAFSPKFVADAVSSLGRRPKLCADPFGGSGTTALTCQFLGIEPATIEVNPFLGDLIEAKLQTYNIADLLDDFATIVAQAQEASISDIASMFGEAPATMVEPGLNENWIFDEPVAGRLMAYRTAIEMVSNARHQRLFRVLLASIVVGVSNVVISGKGRRYRSGWKKRRTPASAVDRAFEHAVIAAAEDITRYGRRACDKYTLFRGDSRELAARLPEAQFALFSPPYPNSFDYTDIYNVELWALGYLNKRSDNRALREATLRSHVQIKRSFEADVPPSPLLERTMEKLRAARPNLWDQSIPEMVWAYFGDLSSIISGLKTSMARSCDIMLVVGDSQYADVKVDVASICQEISREIGFSVAKTHPIRSMRSSAQQGGARELGETLIHLTR